MKYVKRFATVLEANNQGTSGLYSPHVDYINDTESVNIMMTDAEKFICTFNANGKAENVTPVIVGPPNDEIWYTTVNGQICPIAKDYDYDEDCIIIAEIGDKIKGLNNLTIISNTYSDGKGVLKMNGPITLIKDTGGDNSIFRGRINYISLQKLKQERCCWL